MAGLVNYVEKGLGLHDAVRRAGFRMWTQDGKVMADDPVAVQQIIDTYTPVAPVPKTVTNAQARAVLLNTPGIQAATLFDDIDAVLRAGQNGTLAQRQAWQAWEFANEFTRDGTLVQTVGASFGLDDAALDDLFRAAAAVTF